MVYFNISNLQPVVFPFSYSLTAGIPISSAPVFAGEGFTICPADETQKEKFVVDYSRAFRALCQRLRVQEPASQWILRGPPKRQINGLERFPEVSGANKVIAIKQVPLRVSSWMMEQIEAAGEWISQDRYGDEMGTADTVRYLLYFAFHLRETRDHSQLHQTYSSWFEKEERGREGKALTLRCRAEFLHKLETEIFSIQRDIDKIPVFRNGSSRKHKQQISVMSAMRYLVGLSIAVMEMERPKKAARNKNTGNLPAPRQISFTLPLWMLQKIEVTRDELARERFGDDVLFPDALRYLMRYALHLRTTIDKAVLRQRCEEWLRDQNKDQETRKYPWRTQCSGDLLNRLEAVLHDDRSQTPQDLRTCESGDSTIANGAEVVRLLVSIALAHWDQRKGKR